MFGQDEQPLSPRSKDPSGHANDRGPWWRLQKLIRKETWEIGKCRFFEIHLIWILTMKDILYTIPKWNNDLVCPGTILRVLHVTIVVNWVENGNGKWSSGYPDNLLQFLNIGQWVPDQCSYGKGAKFPEKNIKKAFMHLMISDFILSAYSLNLNDPPNVGKREEFYQVYPFLDDGNRPDAPCIS